MKYACVRQHDVTDCAAACLATICKQDRKTVSIAKIREAAGTDKMGTNIKALYIIETKGEDAHIAPVDTP